MNNNKDSGWAWAICIGSFFCNIVVGGQMNCGGVFMSAFVDNYKVNRAEAAWVSALAASSVYFFAPLSTSLCSRIGSRLTVAMGTIICWVALVSSSFHSNFKALYFTYGVLWGLGGSLSYYPSFVILSQYFEKRISLANGISTCGSSIGTLAMSPFLQYLFTRLGMSNGFRVLTCTHALMIIPVYLFRPVVKDKTSKRSTSSRKCCDENVLKNTGFWIWLIAVFLFQLNYMVPYVHLVRLGEDVGASKILASLLISILAGSSFIGRVTFGRIADLACFNRLNICQIALLCIAVSTTLAPFAPSFFWAALYASIFGLNEGIYIMIFMVITKDIVGTDHLPSALGILYGVLFIPKNVGPLLAGFMFDTFQSYVIPFMVMGGLTVVSSVLLFFFPVNTSRKLSKPVVVEETEIICRETTV